MRVDRLDIQIGFITPIGGQRQIERIKRSVQLIPEDALLTLAYEMIGSYANFSESNLKDSDANLYFVENSGRGSRFSFKMSNIVTSSEFPRQIKISIEIGHRV